MLRTLHLWNCAVSFTESALKSLDELHEDTVQVIL